MEENESVNDGTGILLKTALNILHNVTLERTPKNKEKLRKKIYHKKEVSVEETDIKIHIHLVTALRSCFKRGYFGEAYEIFKVLVDHAQCSSNFIWKMLMIFTEKDSENSLQLVSNLTNHFLQLKAGFAPEIRLFRLISLVKQELYSKASFETPKEAKKYTNLTADVASYPAVASSWLLTGYHTLLQYQNVEDGDFTMLEGMAKSFQELFKCKVFYPLFIEAYTLVLLKLEQDDNARQLLYRYVDLESNCNVGVLGAVHAYNIAKLHMRDNIGVTLLLHLLENIAERSPGHPRVLDLCLLLLEERSRSRKENKGLCADFESGASGDVRKRLDYKRACIDKSLKLMFDFLDTYAYREPSDIVKKAWGLMADILRRICVDGGIAYCETIATYWHKNRKHWWPFFQVKKNLSIKPGEATLLSNQAFVCYVFEEEGHPFVQSVLSFSTSTLLRSLINQLRKHKAVLNQKMKHIISENPPEERIRLKSKPKKITSSISAVQNEEVLAYETLKDIDSSKLASSYMNFRARTKSVPPKGHYVSTAFTTPEVEECLALPIEDLVRKRFERRRKLPPRKHIVNPPLTLLQPSDSEDSENAERDDFWSTDQSDSASEEGFEISRNGWLGRLRKHGTLKEDAPDSDGEELFVPKKASIPQVVKMKAQRWNRFLERGRWFTLPNDRKTGLHQYNDLSSDDEYVPGAEFSSSSESDDNKVTARERYLARAKRKNFSYTQLATSSSTLSSSVPSGSSKSRYSPSPKSRSSYVGSRYSPSKPEMLASLQPTLANPSASCSSSSSGSPPSHAFTSLRDSESSPYSPKPESLLQYQRSRYSGSSWDLGGSSRTSSSLPLFTPELYFSDSDPKPSQVISNEEHYRFFELDSFSVCSSTTEDIAKNISKVIKKLELEDCFSGVSFDSTINDLENEYVVEAELPDLQIEPPIEKDRNAHEYLSDAAGKSDTSARETPNRSFSRDFDASSPDMFFPFSENEDDAAEIAKEEISEFKLNAQQNNYIVSSSEKTGTQEPPICTSTPLSLSQVSERQNQINECATLLDNIKSLPTKEKVNQNSANQKKSKSKISQIGDCVQTMDSKDACKSTAVVDASTTTLSKGKKGKLSSSVKSTGVKRARRLSFDASPESKSNTANEKKAKITFPELNSADREELVDIEPSQTPTPISGLSDGSLSRTVFSKVQPKRTTQEQEGEVLSSCSLVLELESSQKDSYKENATKTSESPSSKTKSIEANASEITLNAIRDSKTATSNSSQISQRKIKTCPRYVYSWSDEKQGNNNESFDLLKCRRNSVQQTPTKTQMTMPFLNSVSKSVSSYGESEIEISDRICAATPPSVHELSKPIANSKGKLMKVCLIPRNGEIVVTRKVFKPIQSVTGLKDSQTNKSNAKNRQSKALYGWTVTSTDASDSKTLTSKVDVDTRIDSILNKSDDNQLEISSDDTSADNVPLNLNDSSKRWRRIRSFE